MLSKVIVTVAFASLFALAYRMLASEPDVVLLEEEVAGELQRLREHLFRR